ncbi:MAG: hypothetical protein AAF550_09025 [Myxococcota bacterium]
MNKTLNDLVRGAEGRFLSESEKGAFRAYASNMGSRLDCMRRVESAEADVVEATFSVLLSKHEAHLTAQECQTEIRVHAAQILRFAAQAYVREDLSFFQEACSKWFSDLLCALYPPVMIQDFIDALRSKAEERLDGADYRALRKYLDDYAEKVQKWQES